VGSVPEHPVTVLSPWPCESCTSTSETSTAPQSIAPSSGSTTVTENGIV
jgi:hypothetical protein